VRWMVDGDKGNSCLIRIRANDDAAWYKVESTTWLDTTSEGPQDSPKPIPLTDPYETIERMVNNKWQDLILYRSEYRLPYYKTGGSVQSITAEVAKGSDFKVGMANRFRGNTCYALDPAGKTTRATYFSLGGQEFAVISKTCIRQLNDTTEKIRQAVADSLAIPKSHVIINWDHTHYSDCGEALADSCVAAVRLAKAAARPAVMAWKRVSMGPGYNFRRSGQSPTGMTSAPIDDSYWCLFFKDTAGAPIGAWLRFSGHIGGQLNSAICDSVAAAFGGCGQFFQGGAGTHNVWDNYNANANPTAARPGTWSASKAREVAMAQLPELTFKSVDKMGIAYAWDAVPLTGTVMVNAWVIGDLNLLCFAGESPAEQQLYIAARMHNSPNTMPIGYSNGGGGTYYYWGHDLTSKNNPVQWPNHDGKDQVIRNAETTLRCINIIRNMF
ncbi:MAG: hypothetical protein JNL74_21720, partial [Fibrobacteres bacterium]|nr:hypothetical protein [Fibrobacterota bacterium]